MILSCDLATHKTGFSVFSALGELLFYDKIIANPREKDFRLRIIEIGDSIEKIIKKYKIKIMVIEDVPIMNDAGAYLLVMNGYFTYIAKKYKLKLEMFRPNVWRKPLHLNDGKFKKEIKKKTVEFVNEKYGLNLVFYEKDSKYNISEDDIADSLGLGYFYIHFYNPSIIEGEKIVSLQ